MMKKNEVLEALAQGGYIHTSDIYRTAAVYTAAGDRLDSCRYDTAERIGRTEDHTTESLGAWSNARRIYNTTARPAARAAAAAALDEIRTPGTITIRALADCYIDGRRVTKGETFLVTVYGDGTQAAPGNAYGTLYGFRTESDAIHFEIIDVTEEPRQETAAMTSREAKAARAALIEAHASTRNDGPAAAVAALVDRIGYDAAREIVALLIVAKGEYDGRISERCRAWAYDLTGATRGHLMARGIYYADEIHPAHMDQIGRAMMEYTPEPEPAQEATQAAPVAVRNVATGEIFEGPARTIYGVIAHAVRLARFDCEPLPIFAAISDNAARVILAAAETLDAPDILATVSVDDLAAALDLGDYGDRLNDYRDSQTYICDAISEIADSATSIWYCDIQEFISNHVQRVAEAIDEYGWDGCGRDLYKAGQMAEFMTIERDLYDHLSDAVMLLGCDFLRYDLGLNTIPAALAELLRDWADDADNNDHCDTICDKIREYLEVI